MSVYICVSVCMHMCACMCVCMKGEGREALRNWLQRPRGRRVQFCRVELMLQPQVERTLGA